MNHAFGTPGHLSGAKPASPPKDLAGATAAPGAATCERLVYFFHLPKTGGRTVERFLTERLGWRVINPKKNKAFYSDILLRRKHVDEERRIREALGQACIVGHFAPFALIEPEADKYLKVCFWRHPADWFSSLYNYRHFRNRRKLRRTFGFGDFWRSHLRNPMTEHLLLYCGGLRGARYFMMSDLEKFETALELVAKFDRFQDISKVDDFLHELNPDQAAVHASSNRIDVRYKVLPLMSPAMRRKLERKNPVDWLLHRCALGEDPALLRAEAADILKPRFQLRDIIRAARLPYFRYRVWVRPRKERKGIMRAILGPGEKS